MKKFNLSDYQSLSKKDQRKYLNNVFPIGCCINIKKSLRANSDFYTKDEREVIGYTIYNNKVVLKLDKDLPNIIHDPRVLHPDHAIHNIRYTRKRKLNKILQSEG
jgi:hypothetical protein